MKLLIVEDNPVMRQMIRRLLADLAEDIRECDDGDEALALYCVFQPDWVLMDWQMPRLNGRKSLKFTAWVRDRQSQLDARQFRYGGKRRQARRGTRNGRKRIGQSRRTQADKLCVVRQCVRTRISG